MGGQYVGFLHGKSKNKAFWIAFLSTWCVQYSGTTCTCVIDFQIDLFKVSLSNLWQSVHVCV